MDAVIDRDFFLGLDNEPLLKRVLQLGIRCTTEPLSHTKEYITRRDSNLVPENSDGARRRDLVRRKPGCRQLRRHPQDENLGNGDDRLPEEQERELGLSGGQHLDPAAQTGSEGPDEDA